MRLKRTETVFFGVLLALLLAACSAPAAQTSTAPNADTMAGMDHSTMPSMSDAPYDAAFIDGMILHHEGAIIMANQALEQAERQAIKDLANEIVGAQEGEISQMQAWRAEWFAELAATGGMAMDMGPMAVPAGDAPFDQRFIQAMIPHHVGAIAMAQDALQNAERQEIKDLAQAIISAQEAEIAQMRQWLQEWYGIEQ